MKLVLLAIILLTARSGDAQWENVSRSFERWPVRIMAGRKYNLSSVYRWWTNAAALSQIQQDGNYRAYYKRKHGIEPAEAIPPRPMAAWCRVLGTNFQPCAYGWIVQGEIEDGPGARRPATFILEHPPVKDKERFESSRREWAGLIQAGHVQVATQQFIDERGYRSWNVRGIEVKSARGQFLVGLDDAGVRHAQELADYLAHAPPGDVYRLDFLAVKAGVSRDASHLEVWDLGYIPGTLSN